MRLRSNKKLRKSNIYQFTLPALVTCPMSGACRQFCYANKGCFRFRQPKAFHLENFKLSQSDEFINIINDELNRRWSIKTIRIHDSGDFYSQEYLDRWVQIIKANPNHRFYTYTKSLHLDWSKADKLPNFKRIQSFGGLMDDQIDLSKSHARIFNNIDELLTEGYVDCHDDDSIAANKDTIKIGLIKH